MNKLFYDFFILIEPGVYQLLNKQMAGNSIFVLVSLTSDFIVYILIFASDINYV